MTRKLLVLVLAVCATGAQAQNLRATLDKAYQQLNKALIAKDAKALEKWVQTYCTADFTYTSRDKHKYTRKAFLDGLKQQAKATKKVLHSTVRTGSPVVTGTKLSVVTMSDFKGIVTIDRRDLTLTDKSETRDVWVRLGSSWKLRSIVQTKADTQISQ